MEEVKKEHKIVNAIVTDPADSLFKSNRNKQNGIKDRN